MLFELDDTENVWEHLLTAEERQEALSLMEEEIRGSLSDIALEKLMQGDVIELLSYACPDPSGYADTLQRIHSESDEAYITGEFLRLHDDDGDDYAGMLDWCKRFNLINEAEDELTEHGVEFMGRNQ